MPQDTSQSSEIFFLLLLYPTSLPAGPFLPPSATTRPVPPSLTAPPPGQTPVAAGAEPPSAPGLSPPAPSLTSGVRGQLQCRPTSHHAGPFLLSPLMRRLQGSLRRSAPAGRASLPHLDFTEDEQIRTRGETYPRIRALHARTSSWPPRSVREWPQAAPAEVCPSLPLSPSP